MAQADREAEQEARLKRLEEAVFGKPPGPEPTPTPTPPVTATDTPLKIVTATGSAPDGTNLPANAIDNDPNTRFSSLGIGAFLKLDFGVVQQVNKIDFEWYNNPPRTYTVDVILEGSTSPLNHVSTDTGKSSLVVPSIAAQTITIKLVDTSNVKKWLSIVDVKVFGKQLNEPPITPSPVPPQPTPTPEPTPTPPTGNTTKSGIKLLANPKTGGYHWELDISKDPNSDANFVPEGGKCTAGTDSNSNVKFWNMKGKDVSYRSGGASGKTNRLSIYFNGGKGSKQTHTWKDQTGFLWKQGDPKNYVVISTIRPHHSLASNIHHESSIKNRGGNHSSSAPDNASTVELTQEMAGNMPRWAREYTHPSYDYNKVDTAGPNAKNLGIVVDKWFMRQLISRELPDGTGVSYEYYINANPFKADGSINNDSWELYSKVVDKDGFNSGKYKVAAKWSGFLTTIRIDGFQDIDISHHAFIEINPS